MSDRCVICGSERSQPVWSVSRTPLVELIDLDTEIDERLFAPMEIVGCTGCGHLFNRAHDPDHWRITYRKRALSCKPVHISMLDYLDGVVDWIGRHYVDGKRVLDVGAGSGVLARKLSCYARQVECFEPNLELTPEALPEPNIDLISEPFSRERATGGVDLAICKQVLEHIDDPLQMLTGIRRLLTEGGILYLEVPTLEYIQEHDAFFEFYNEHVHYFSRENLLRLLSRAGFSVLKEISIKEGHDRGFLLQADGEGREVTTSAVSQQEESAHFDHGDFAARLQRSLQRLQERIDAIGGEIALYGATSQGSALLNALFQPQRFQWVFDDNEDHEGRALFSPVGRVAVESPHRVAEDAPDAVLICAYLHRKAIAERLCRLGFEGAVLALVEEERESQ